MTKVKICGIQEIEHAKAAVAAGADAIGFVFAKSKRQISVEQAKRISDQLPANILRIGVFVNATKEELESTAEEVGLHFLQLHGDESFEFASSLSFPYIKAFRITEERDLEHIASYHSNLFLLDSGHGPFAGGNGTSFEWDLLTKSKINRNKLILAGGLDSTNVERAIKEVNPYMVDVSSGVETAGKKDIDKIKEFIKIAKRTRDMEEMK